MKPFGRGRFWKRHTATSAPRRSPPSRIPASFVPPVNSGCVSSQFLTIAARFRATHDCLAPHGGMNSNLPPTHSNRPST